MKSKRKLALALIVVFAVNIFVISFINPANNAEAAIYRRGSTGSIVTEIQRRLYNWGYYSDGIDGIFGSRTEKAVRYFQQKNGLAVDGIVGKATLAALGINASSGASTQSNQVNLLAKLIAAEARGEPYSGQVAVGAVVLNRIEHPSFPNTLSGVIYQPGAFTCMVDGQWGSAVVTDSALRAARDALNGWDPAGGAIYYFNPATATNKWIWSRPLIVVIGKHRFCS